MNQHTLKTDNYTVVFKNTIANSIKYSKMVAWANEGDENAGLRNQFVYIASHIDSWEGGGWKPPRSIENTELTKSYDAFILRFSIEQMREMASAVDTLHNPMSSDVAKPDASLSDMEAADPN